jgi:hypothetical protein
MIIQMNELHGIGVCDTWPSTDILTFAFILAFDCEIVEMPKLMPLYPKGWV